MRGHVILRNFSKKRFFAFRSNRFVTFSPFFHLKKFLIGKSCPPCPPRAYKWLNTATEGGDMRKNAHVPLFRHFEQTEKNKSLKIAKF